MTADALNYRALTGAALAATLDDVARLRIAVFREYPHLYDGDLAYERRYLHSYRDNPSAIVVGAFDDGRLVGASTGTALKGHDPAFVGPVAGAGLDISRVFYCAESVLLAEYRGRGAGHAFFDMREARALASGHDISVFCAVIRSDDHPQKPGSYRPLDPFWRARGYRPLEGAVAAFDWKEIGEAPESTHRLAFWWRRLSP
ncbi:MAG: GNAT family N-acetyltransferase [Paracoccaceae bacterium]|nr:GNAT family N-acetyltransferase [Paracoccaceae bacterium]